MKSIDLSPNDLNCLAKCRNEREMKRYLKTISWSYSVKAKFSLTLAAMVNNVSVTREILQRNPEITKKKANNALHVAVEAGNADIVKCLLDHKVDPDASLKVGQRPLISKAVGNMKILRLLINSGANPNVADVSTGITPLMEAVARMDTESARLLLNYRADVNAVEFNKGLSPLLLFILMAQNERNLDLLHLLLSHGADVNFHMRDPIWSPLTIAVHFGLKKVVRELIKQRADINFIGSDGLSPLMRAVMNQDTEMVKMLLSHKADTSLTDASGMTPLGKAVQNGHLEIVDLLLDAGSNIEAGIGGKHFQKTKKLAMEKHKYLPVDEHFFLDHGKDEISPLMIAVTNDDLRMVGRLLLAGANIDTRSSEGNTALMTSVCYGTKHVFKYLLKKGADVNFQNFNGMTALMFAVLSNSYSMVKHLLNNHADPLICDNTGNPVLVMAAQSCNLHIIKLLAQTEPGLINMRSPNGKSPLLVAVDENRLRVAQYLLERGAKIDTAKKGMTYPSCVELAFKNRNQNMIDLLFKYGAKDKQGNCVVM